MLNKEQISKPHNCPCSLCKEWQLWQAEAWREDGEKLFVWDCVSLTASTREQKQTLV